MILETNTTNRRALVHQIAEILNIKPEYAGMPTCAYHVGAGDHRQAGKHHPRGYRDAGSPEAIPDRAGLPAYG